MPPAASRNELAATLRGASFIKASAVAFEGQGFRAAAVRGVVTGLTALARQPFPHKVFAHVAMWDDGMVSVTGVTNQPSNPAYAQTALGVQGRFGESWQIGVRGNMQRFEDPTIRLLGKRAHRRA